MEKIVLPEPTLDNPFLQIDFLFERVGSLKSGRNRNFRGALSYYKRCYLPATHNYSEMLREKNLFYIEEQWDEFALIKLQTFMDEANTTGSVGRLSSAYVVSISTTFRTVLEYAGLHKLTSCSHVLAAACPPVVRETTQNAAYSDKEMDVVNSWLKGQLEEVSKWLAVKEYIPTGVGEDPRKVLMHGDSADATHSDVGWENIDNLRWYFENVMNCEAALRPAHHNQRHYWFYLYASKYPGGYGGLIKDWQIKPLVTLDLVMPLALKLSLETGLNPTSLWNLTIDCLQENHPLSGVAYLKYYKARSKGHMEMHLNIYDKNVAIREFKEAQVKVIRRTIEAVIKLTAPLREKAPKEMSNLLFIAQVPGYVLAFDEQRPTWRIRNIDDKNSSDWIRRQVFLSGLKSEDGSPLQLAVGRFRSTRITDMVRQGVDFFEIQSNCGHQSILTTFRYISKNNLEVKARKDVSKAIATIYQNQVWQKTVQPEYISIDVLPSTHTVYKSVLGDCKNVLDPPDDVKKLKNYQPNQVCTRYNMCLFCNNVVIMRHHLPLLVIYQRQIINAIGNNSSELPNAQHYERTIGVLESILNPKSSEFSKEELDWAFNVAENADELIDPVVFRPNL